MDRLNYQHLIVSRLIVASIVIIITTSGNLSFQVVLNVGLCIVLHDLTYVGDSYIFPGDGASHTKGTALAT